MADFYFAGADESAAGRVFLVQLSLDACPSSGRFRGRIQHMNPTPGCSETNTLSGTSAAKTCRS